MRSVHFQDTVSIKDWRCVQQDYAVIINQCDVELLVSDFTFHQTDKYNQVFERKLSPEDVGGLKEYQDRLVKAKHNKYGRVYELKGNSFKTFL